MQYRIKKPEFAASQYAARIALDKVNPDLYAKSRNFIDGAVSYLSPYITHGLLNTHDVAQTLTQRHPLSFDDKLIFELAWREFFLHVHSHMGHNILKDIRRPCWSGHYAQEMPQDLLEARTGISVIDESIRLLYEAGYLHNHMRMWIASYTVHLRKVHWKAGADWMYGHLLDGDIASNYLSWQWVAGTFSHKPYVFNADNVCKYAKQYSCKGTVIDASYEDMEAIARSRKDCGPEHDAPLFGIEIPMLMDARIFFATHDIAIAHNGKPLVMDLTRAESAPEHLQLYASLVKHVQAVYWVHPWCLALGEAKPAELTDTSNTLRLGWIDEAFFDQHPWSVKRWQFVWSYFTKHCDAIVISNSHHASGRDGLLQLANTLKALPAMHHTQTTYNTGYVDCLQVLPIKAHSICTILPKLNQPQASFSRFYREATLIAGSLEESLAHADNQQEA